MSFWCDNKLTITGPNRELVLNAVKRETTDEGEPLTIFFNLEALRKSAEAKGVPTPEATLPVEKSLWVSVYVGEQTHEATADSDILRFESKWVEPVVAIRVLSRMFPENTFELHSWCDELVYWEDEAAESNGSQVCHSVFRDGEEKKIPKQATTKSEGLPLRTIPQLPAASDAQ